MLTPLFRKPLAEAQRYSDIEKQNLKIFNLKTVTLCLCDFARGFLMPIYSP